MGDNIKADFEEDVDWIYLIQGKDLSESGDKAFRFHTGGGLLPSWATVSFLKKTGLWFLLAVFGLLQSPETLTKGV
jgi:hypothetical protein